MAQAVKLYIKDTNDFLNKPHSLPKLPGIIICTVDIVYPNIPPTECLSALRKWLDNWMKKYISSDMLGNLAEVVPKNNIFKFGKKKKKTLKQIKETAIGMNWNMVELKDEILWKAEFKPYVY